MPLGYAGIYGISGAGFPALLDDLTAQQGRDPGDQGRSLFLATFDSADLIHVRMCSTPFELGTVGAGSSMSFRRALGFHAPDADQWAEWVSRVQGVGGSWPLGAAWPGEEDLVLEGDRGKGEDALVVTLEKLLGPKPEPRDHLHPRPVYGLVTARLSPLVKLATRPLDGQEVDGREHYLSVGQHVLAALLTRRDGTPSLHDRARTFPYLSWGAGAHEPAPPVVMPLIGLDGHEIMLLVQGCSLGAVGAAAFAVRTSLVAHANLPVVDPEDSDVEGDVNLGRLMELTGISDKARLKALWPGTSLFSSVETLVGARLVGARSTPNRPREVRHCVRRRTEEGGPPEVADAADRLRVAGGLGVQAPLDWYVDVDTERATEHAATGHFPTHLAWAPPVEGRGWEAVERLLDTRADGGGGDGAHAESVRYYYFGLANGMVVDGLDGTPVPVAAPLCREYTFDALASMLARLCRNNGVDTVTTTTVPSILVRTEPLRELVRDCELSAAMRRTLRRARRYHTGEGGFSAPQRGGPLVPRWHGAAARELVPRAQEISISNLLAAVLDDLETNPELVCEAFWPLRDLVESMSTHAGVPQHEEAYPKPVPLRHAPKPWEVAVIAEQVEDLVGIRARRNTRAVEMAGNFALEAHAGYVVPRDAFWVTTLAFARAMGVHGPVVVRDLASGRTSTRAGPGAVTTIMVSAITVHLPIQWIYGHELAHAALHQLAQGRALEDDPRIERAWRELNQVLGDDGDTYSSLNNLMYVLQRRFRMQLSHLDVRKGAFVNAMAGIAPEVLADIMQVAMLRRRSDRGLREAEARHWFMTGPAFVREMSQEYGPSDLFIPRVARFILRVTFVTWLVDLLDAELRDEPAQGQDWFDVLDEVLRHLRGLGGAPRETDDDVGTFVGATTGPTRRALEILYTLRHDLECARIQPAVSNLFRDVRMKDCKRREGSSQSPTRQMVDGWLELGVALGRWVATRPPPQQRTPQDEWRRPSGDEGDVDPAARTTRQSEWLREHFIQYLDDARRLLRVQNLLWPAFARSRRTGRPLRGWRARECEGPLLSHRGGFWMQAAEGELDGERLIDGVSDLARAPYAYFHTDVEDEDELREARRQALVAFSKRTVRYLVEVADVARRVRANVLRDMLRDVPPPAQPEPVSPDDHEGTEASG